MIRSTRSTSRRVRDSASPTRRPAPYSNMISVRYIALRRLLATSQSRRGIEQASKLVGGVDVGRLLRRQLRLARGQRTAIDMASTDRKPVEAGKHSVFQRPCGAERARSPKECGDARGIDLPDTRIAHLATELSQQRSGRFKTPSPAIAAAARRRRSPRSASLEVPQVEVADFAEGHDVHLGVGAGRRRAAMPQVVADLLEGKAIGKKLRRAGMPQRMRSRVSGLDAKRDKLAIGNVVEAAGLYRAPRCLQSYENFRSEALAGAPYRCSGPVPRQRTEGADRPALAAASNEIVAERDCPNRSGQAAETRLRRCASRRSQAASGSLGCGCRGARRSRSWPGSASHRTTLARPVRIPGGRPEVARIVSARRASHAPSIAA